MNEQAVRENESPSAVENRAPLVDVVEHEEANGYRTRSGWCSRHGKLSVEVFTPFHPRFAEFLKKEGDWVGGCPDCKADEAQANAEIDAQQPAIRAWVYGEMKSPKICDEREKAIAARLREKLAEYEQRIRPDVEAEVNEEIWDRLALEREDAIRAERLAKRGAGA